MNALSLPAPRGVTGRADLLRLLATAPRDVVLIDQDASGWFGYVPRSPPVVGVPPVGAKAGATVGKVTIPRERKAPLKLPFLHVLVRREVRPQFDGDVPPPSEWEPAGQIEEADAKSLSERRLINFEDLVPQARLMPALRRLLGANRPGALDVGRLTRQVATCRIPRHLPRRTYPCWHPDLIVVLDFSTRLWPYRWDMHQLAKRLLRLVGRTGVSLRIVNYGPLGPWSDWLAHQNRTSPIDPPERDWTMPPAGTAVLLVSDLGMLLGWKSATAATWAAFVDDLTGAGLRPVALVPLGAAQLGAPVPARLPVLRWSPDARPHAVPVRGEAIAEPDGLDDLIAMIAATRRIDPPLLRAMRRLNPKASQNAGLEGAAWCHADVEAIHTASILSDARETHLRRFRTLPPLLQVEVDQVRSTHHRHLRVLINHEEALWWKAHVEASTVALSLAAIERDRAAGEFFRKMAKTVASADPETAARWRSVAEGVVWRADAAMAERCSDALYPIMASLERTKGEEGPLPEWVDPQKLAAAMGSDRPGKPHWLVRDAASARLVLQAQPPGARQSLLVDDLAVDDGGLRIMIESNDSRRAASGAVLPALDPRETVMIETSSECLLVAAVERPLGALSWGCDREGIFVESPPFGLWQARWYGLSVENPSLRGEEPGRRRKYLRPVPRSDGQTGWALEAGPSHYSGTGEALAFGIEPRFGIYTDLTIATEHGRARQRLRWIPPGTFLMGSPEDEPGRFENEGPRHEVTISKGFWLFDTPCLQALWQAVMGDNPSYFKSPDRPVEQVSWEDVQRFLDRVNALLPGLDLMLATEAEWEYSCRAGTETAIYTGHIQILGERNAPALDPVAWYAGNSGVEFDLDKGIDSSGWRDKQHPHTRAGTRPVARKQPNDWGLYDMLGNVWEWCRDGQRTYTADGVTDPVGPMEARANRVLRGGSWIRDAGSVRSAYRRLATSGNRPDFIGFRARVQEGLGRSKGL